MLLYLINSLIIATVVLLHYEALYRLSLLLSLLRIRSHYRVLLGMFGAFLAHVIEVWLFALAYFFMHRHDKFGTVEGLSIDRMTDFAYFSFVTYTTVGYGDLVPVGDIRFLAALESLAGLMLITWSASFIFIEMQRSWAEAPQSKD